MGLLIDKINFFGFLIFNITIKRKIMSNLIRNMPIVHPGEILKSELIEANGLTVTEVASLLKVSRQAFSNIINKKADLSPEMALRIATVFGGPAEIWLRLQAKYDLEKAEKKIRGFNLTPFRAST